MSEELKKLNYKFEKRFKDLMVCGHKCIITHLAFKDGECLGNS
jgi:hypothetical protein